MSQYDSPPSGSPLADVLADLLKQLQDQHITPGGPINVEELKATNVVSGLQIILSQQGQVPSSPSSSTSLLWTITSRRNPYFVGREDLLTTLANIFRTSKGAFTSLALSGLGGIGKTQIALEYAFRFVADYKYVFWARAAASESMIADYVTFATLLSLPEKDEQDQLKIVEAVKQWLITHDRWLLILDNADDLVMVRSFLPTSPTGHILLTTRAEVTAPLAQRIEINTLSIDTAALFLLQRASILDIGQPLNQASPADQALARRLSTELGGLALALDQAGAYILEEGISLSGYLQKYEASRAQLLDYRGGDLVEDHPDSVTKTMLLLFQLLQQRHPIAADLLCLCTFLAADAIPEELFTQGTAKLEGSLSILSSNPQQLNTTLKALRAYSLVRRNLSNQTISIHRLVQTVLQDSLEETARRTWAERVMMAVNATFPHVEHGTWAQCERLLPQALAGAQRIEQYQMISEAAGRLLFEIASYLKDRARYREAEPLYQRALQIREQQVGPDHPDVAQSLNNLANLYSDQGKYAEAEPLHQRALQIREQQVGPDHPDVAQSLNNLALLYSEQGKYAEAEPLHQRALQIQEQQVGPKHPETAETMHNLARFREMQGNSEEARLWYARALSIREQVLGAHHSKTTETRKRLIALLLTIEQHDEAARLEAVQSEQGASEVGEKTHTEE
ncbi:FxSxx-COOH system tetratricopeptide repeat protein [Ktedonobacter racemifer]|uniref:TPR repeat-containing protein n=1 Tax=Ktedonobacter racemifer DSM 44963 TaxID=485913 RepID=D6U731_KTERA|nr:FxSxx-COOH system tetratricopeptide repeat protein [Ktedonobacter racemifer]EFH79692.1 TPR repeat-containing protein [Ktedonobacter racemifer DSM 44963]